MPVILKTHKWDFSLVGAPTNPKSMSFGSIVKLWDARDMVGGGSL